MTAINLSGDHLALLLSTWAAGLTRADYPLGSGECYNRARAVITELDHLPLQYVEGVLHHCGDAMGDKGSGVHAFCLLQADGEMPLVVDPMVGEYLVTVGGDASEFTWEISA